MRDEMIWWMIGKLTKLLQFSPPPRRGQSIMVRHKGCMVKLSIACVMVGVTKSRVRYIMRTKNVPAEVALNVLVGEAIFG